MAGRSRPGIDTLEPVSLLIQNDERIDPCNARLVGMPASGHMTLFFSLKNYYDNGLEEDSKRFLSTFMVPSPVLVTLRLDGSRRAFAHVDVSGEASYGSFIKSLLLDPKAFPGQLSMGKMDVQFVIDGDLPFASTPQAIEKTLREDGTPKIRFTCGTNPFPTMLYTLGGPACPSIPPNPNPARCRCVGASGTIVSNETIQMKEGLLNLDTLDVEIVIDTFSHACWDHYDCS